MIKTNSMTKGVTLCMFLKMLIKLLMIVPIKMIKGGISKLPLIILERI